MLKLKWICIISIVLKEMCVNLPKSCVNFIFLCKFDKEPRCFLEKFTQLGKILHDRRSRRSRQISSLISILQVWVSKGYHIMLNWQIQSRLEICRDRRDQRSCKIFVSCVNFSKKQRGFLLIWQVYTHLNANFIHNC